MGYRFLEKFFLFLNLKSKDAARCKGSMDSAMLLGLSTSVAEWAKSQDKRFCTGGYWAGSTGRALPWAVDVTSAMPITPPAN